MLFKPFRSNIIWKKSTCAIYKQVIGEGSIFWSNTICPKDIWPIDNWSTDICPTRCLINIAHFVQSSLILYVCLKQGPVLLKHYRFVMYIIRSKVVCLPKPVKVTDQKKTLAYFKICSSSVNYESAIFYSTGLTCQLAKCRTAK